MQGQELIAEQTLLKILNEKNLSESKTNYLTDIIDAPINLTIQNEIQKAQLKYQVPSFETAKLLD